MNFRFKIKTIDQNKAHYFRIIVMEYNTLLLKFEQVLKNKNMKQH